MTKAGSNTVTRKLKMEVLIQVIACLLAQSCLTLCNPMDWEILEWVVISSSRGSFWCRDQTCVSYISYNSQHCTQPGDAVPSQGTDGGRAGAENLTYDFWLGYRLTRKCESKIILCLMTQFASLENDYIILQNLSTQCWGKQVRYSLSDFSLFEKNH